jgi:hypothetical protein
MKNGELLRRARGAFDVFLTADQNLEHQQNIAALPFAVVVLVAASNRVESYAPLATKIREVLKEFAVRSRPVVAAIEAYEREKGHPPPDLQALVPGYLPSVPSTGMGAFPDFIYRADGRGGWRLRVPVGVTPFEWEALEYRPSQGSPRPPTRFDGWELDVG